MCVCVYVCMYVCMYVCVYVCMYACMHVCMYVSVIIYASMYLCIYVSMYLCMHVCMSTHGIFQNVTFWKEWPWSGKLGWKRKNNRKQPPDTVACFQHQKHPKTGWTISRQPEIVVPKILAIYNHLQKRRGEMWWGCHNSTRFHAWEMEKCPGVGRGQKQRIFSAGFWPLAKLKMNRSFSGKSGSSLQNPHSSRWCVQKWWSFPCHLRIPMIVGRDLVHFWLYPLYRFVFPQFLGISKSSLPSVHRFYCNNDGTKSELYHHCHLHTMSPWIGCIPIIASWACLKVG